MTVNHPQFGTMCEICFERITEETCAVDVEGTKWDVCKGECAKEAGIHERKSEQTMNANVKCIGWKIKPGQPKVFMYRGIHDCGWATGSLDGSTGWRTVQDKADEHMRRGCTTGDYPGSRWVDQIMEKSKRRIENEGGMHLGPTPPDFPTWDDVTQELRIPQEVRDALNHGEAWKNGG